MSKSICILGLGYIGLPTALLFAKEGNTVLGVDIDQDKIQKLNQEILPFEETGLKKLYENAKHNFTASTSTKPSDVFLIAVPTPITKEKKCDLRYVVAATNSIKNHLKKGDLVILESTVRPRTTIDIVKPILEETGLICGQDFFLAYVPEKAIPGKTLEEMQNNHRLIGGITKSCAQRAKELYTFVKTDMPITSATTCETVKLFENTYRDVNIALANEFKILSKDFKINVHEAIRYANKHPRVNIHSPGPGVGGHCIPIDPYFLIDSTKSKNSLIEKSRSLNNQMPDHAVEFILIKINPNAKIALCGLSYKANVDDDRESPSYQIYEQLTQKGYDIIIIDPYFTNKKHPKIKKQSNTIKNVNTLIIATNHKEFEEFSAKDFEDSPVHTIIDLKSCLKNKQELQNKNITIHTFGDYS